MDEETTNQKIDTVDGFADALLERFRLIDERLTDLEDAMRGLFKALDVRDLRNKNIP